MKYKRKYYLFLDRLRESGVTNMFGSPIYLEQYYSIDSKESIGIVADWMETFSDRKRIGDVRHYGFRDDLGEDEYYTKEDFFNDLSIIE